jgi:hypothetical protein
MLHGSLFRGGPKNLDFFMGVGSHGGDVGRLPDIHREFLAPPEVDGSSARCSSNFGLPGIKTLP